MNQITTTDETATPAAPLEPVARRPRLLIPLALAGVIAIGAIALALRSGGGNGPPATGSARLVPPDALLYLHVSTDRGRDGTSRALDLAKRFPALSRVRDALLRRLSAAGAPVNYRRDIEPWVGGEAALALLNTTSQTAGSLIVVSVSDRRRAEAYLKRAAGPSSATTYRGARIARYGNTATAFVGRYLVVGQETSLRSAIDSSAGRAPSLARSSTFRRATRSLSRQRAADVYLSAGGVRRLLATQTGPLGIAGVLLDQPALAGAAVGLTPRAGGARLDIHSELDPALARQHPSVFRPFTPQLVSDVPKTAMAYLGVAGLDRVAGRLLTAGVAGGSTGARLDQLVRRAARSLATAAGVNVDRDILPLLRNEVGLWLAPTLPAPTLTLIARTKDEEATRVAFSRLQTPLAKLFAPPSAGPGQAPVFNERDVDGTKVFSLELAANVEIDYAVFAGKLVVSTNLDGVRAVRRGKGSITERSGFQATLGQHPARVTSLVFLDFRQLLDLGERTGLMQSRSYLSVRNDLRRVRALGVSSSGGRNESTTELSLQIS
ncbi:MAG: hypothetical protein QOK04_1183 [Solirubrobacteraceae bacterium]|jgi:hypothetical protein|nr:hypothetical protein [Solirubrobacteraceae bacterium]